MIFNAFFGFEYGFSEMMNLREKRVKNKVVWIIGES